jgi:AbrB family looped-hinge helix DNA binding protein
MRISARGQVTIPAEIRERAGLLPGVTVDFILEGDTVRLVRAPGPGEDAGRGRRLLAHLRAHPGDLKMTTDEIMALTRGE